MTENEAIEELQNSIDLAKMCTQNYERKREIQGYEMAIEALKEVQQYRKHGITVENVLNNMRDLAAAENLIEEYRAIGTLEECLRNKDFLDFISDKMNPNDFETYLRLYNALEEKGCEE